MWFMNRESSLNFASEIIENLKCTSCNSFSAQYPVEKLLAPEVPKHQQQEAKTDWKKHENIREVKRKEK